MSVIATKVKIMGIRVDFSVLMFFVFQVLLFNSKDCEALCTDADRITWSPITNESAYDRDPNSLNDISARPLGFQFDTVEYIDNADPKRPCVTITNCLNKRLEIMVETDPAAMICVEDVSTDADSRTQICGEKIYSCGQCPETAGNSGDVDYQFSCTGQSCDQSDVNFWFRFVPSDPAIPDPELWCDARNSGEYPSSLVVINPVQPGPATTEEPTGRGVSVVSVLPLLVLLSTLLAFLGQH